MPSKNDLQDRLELLRTSGVPVSDADETRVRQSVLVSLAALEATLKGSLFDTEPQAFDVVLRQLARARRHG